MENNNIDWLVCALRHLGIFEKGTPIPEKCPNCGEFLPKEELNNDSTTE